MKASLFATVFVLVLFSSSCAHEHADRDPPHGWEDVESFRPVLNGMMSLREAWSASVGKPSDVPGGHCAHCAEVTRLVEKLFSNGTTLKEIEGVVDVLCDVLVHNMSDPFNRICRDIPGLVAKLVDYGEATNANITNVVCADFAHACTQRCCISKSAPEQVHLSFAQTAIVGPAVDMQVAWVTEVNASGACVRYQVNAGPWAEAAAVTDTYTIGGWVGTLYFATMAALPPNATVRYQVGSAGAWSTVFNFSTLPENAGTPTRPLRIIGLADMGFGPNGRPTVAALSRAVNRGAVDFILHPGDIGYADGDQAWWDDFMRLMEPIMSRVPYMTGPGNHECIWYNCTAYKKRFRMPAAGAGAPADAMYYALQAPPAGLSMLMLNSETWYDTPDIDAVQRRWMVDVFNSEASSAAPFKLVMHHRPLYCLSSSTECTVFAPRLRAQVEGLYRDHGVAAVMVGHIHNYQRTWPVFNGSVVSHDYTNAAAPTNFINGGAGNREGQMPFTGPQYAWAAKYTTERTYMSYVVWRDPVSGNVTFDATTIQSRTNAVVDHLTIVRSPRHAQP